MLKLSLGLMKCIHQTTSQLMWDSNFPKFQLWWFSLDLPQNMWKCKKSFSDLYACTLLLHLTHLKYFWNKLINCTDSIDLSFWLQFCSCYPNKPPLSRLFFSFLKFCLSWSLEMSTYLRWEFPYAWQCLYKRLFST